MSIKKLMMVICLSLLTLPVLQAQNFKYVGSAKCKVCHNSPAKGAQYKIWEASKHAHAMESLKGADAKNPKCLKCHSTYYEVSPNLRAGIKADEGVSCESCHGPGSAYKSYGIMKNRQKAIEKGLVMPNEKTCTKCHNSESPNFKGFDYKTYLAKIAHPIPKH
jgi:nitrate/TMAO reductase-like tetraheme cytochrome c subunit